MEAPKHIVQEFLSALKEEGINQSQFAERCGLGSAYISRFVGGSRPEDPLFRNICTQWKNKPELGQKVVLAHLRDEIDRSGHSLGEFELKASGVKSEDSALDSALEILRRVALEDKVVREHVLSLVRIMAGRLIMRERSRGGE